MTFYIDADYISLNHVGEELCGDKVEIVRTDESSIFVLSDGLGSGVKANILATLTSKIIITMMKEGSTIEEVVETIAATLPICKVRQVAYSTFSILQVFDDGRAYLVEFDGPECVMIRDGKIMQLDHTEREVAGKNIRESRFEVKLGDVFALFSDGVPYAGVGAVLNLGWQWENVAAFFRDAARKKQSVPRMLTSIAQMISNLYQGKPGDDSTVLVAQVVPKHQVNFFSGPPKDKANDERLVHDWYSQEGLKIVAGGTSANIVSRVLGVPINASLYADDPDIPPTATMRGVDLVTEGVLTINRTLEILRQYRSLNPEDCDDYFRRLDANNGAAELARILLEKCTHLNLFIGKAINPAHQNPNLPMDLSIKMRLIEELTQEMRAMGKIVNTYVY